MHASSTLDPKGSRAIDAKPLVATSSVRLRGAAASPPPNALRSGQRKLRTDCAVGLSSLEPAARAVRRRRREAGRFAFRDGRTAAMPLGLSATAAMFRVSRSGKRRRTTVRS